MRSKAAKVMGGVKEGGLVGPGRQSPLLRLARQGGARRQLSRQSSGEEGLLRPASLGSSILRQGRVRALARSQGPGARRNSPLAGGRSREEAKELVLTADFKGVSADLMTSKFQFANLRVEDLHTVLEVSHSKTRLMAKLRQVRLVDMSPHTLYRTLVESQGQEVFTACTATSGRT